MRQDLLLETMWEESSEEEFSALWQAEVEEMRDKTRTSTLYLVAGLLLPVWDRLPDDHVQVWRLNTDDGQSFLRSEEHTSELQSLMRISYAVFCLTKKNTN